MARRASRAMTRDGPRGPCRGDVRASARPRSQVIRPAAGRPTALRAVPVQAVACPSMLA